MGKLVVVLDLDETVVFSRGDSISVRPGVSHLLCTLKGRCELIVWTAGTRDYALDVIRFIDPYCAIQHCIYRHPIWWTGTFDSPKDLRLLGRPLKRTVIVDNTPEVLRLHPSNSLLVSDYLGDPDTVLFTLSELFDKTFQNSANPTAVQLMSSKGVQIRSIRLECCKQVNLNTLVGDVIVDARPAAMRHSFID